MSRRPTARRRARAGLERRVRVAFRTAGALMLAGMLLLVVGSLAGLTPGLGVLATVLFWWPAFVAVVVGLQGIVGRLGDRVRRVARMASAVFGVGAVALPLLMVIGFIQMSDPHVMASTLDIILVGMFVCMLIMLAALLVALTVVGAAVWRSGLGKPAAGPLLIMGGLLTLVPPALFLTSGAASQWPVWPWLALLAGWAVIFFALGSALPSDSGSTEPSVNKGGM